MKTTKLFLKVFLALFLFSLNINNVASQERQIIGVVNFDTNDLIVDNKTMTNMIHLELEKANVYEVLDKYDVALIVKEQGINIDECFGKACMVNVGEILGADKMLTGSAERFGNKLIFILRLIDVKNDRIEKTDVVEFINQQDYLQTMTQICINNILDIENDKYLVDLLVNFDQPIISAKSALNLTGPRVGFTYATGNLAQRLTASKSKGGFNMYPVSNIIGYQYEQQFLSSGDFQALFEILPTVSGLESGLFIPSLTTMLGFRFSNSGWEFGLGPVFRVSKMAYGHYDSEGNWILRDDIPYEKREGIVFQENVDSRGRHKLTAGMIFAFGRTFRSGYLNMPVNIYVSPNREGAVIGLIMGFNVAKNRH